MNQQQGGGIIFAIFSLLYLLFAQDIETVNQANFNARTFPYILGTLGMIVSLLLIMTSSSQQSFFSLFKLKWTKVILLSVTMIGYAALLPRVGFLLATILFLNVCFLIMNENRWRVMFYASFSLTCGFWFILTQLLNIHLSSGSWWRI